MKIYNPFKFARKNAHWAITLVFILTALGSNAQAAGDNSGIMMFVIALVAIVAVLVLMVAIYALQVINKLEANQPAKEGEDSLWKRFLEIANNRAPEDKEADIMMDHNYDGIRELDNHLPPWWKWLFYITIIWGVIYLVGHHFTGWFPLQEEEYETEMALANAEKKANQDKNAEAGGFDVNALVYSADAAMIEAGKKTFGRNCIACHGAVGEGNAVGPNLVDEYWLHGGGIKNVFNTIINGVPDKGMISWKSQLSPTDIRDVATYIISIGGSNPPNAKKPQGTIYEEGAEPATADASQSNTKDLSKGKAIFDANCAACHTPDGGGIMGLGPNLTDKYWKDSNGSREGVMKTIEEGVAGSAMMSWKALLDETQMNDVTDYVLAFQGTTPANPKEPEGDLYEDGGTNTAAEVESGTEGSLGDVSEGKSIFETTCAACHTADGGGVPGLGPNLTDKYWKTGNGTKETVKKTIVDGVAGTAMMAWSAALNENQIEAVTNFVLSLKGTTPAAPKAPEGDLYE